MQMTSQEARKICAYLAATRLLLQKSDRATAPTAQRIKMIEGELCPADVTYVGDAGAAKVALDRVVDQLARLRRIGPAAAVSNEAILPTVNPQLLPGVSEAINQIGKAVEVLQFVRDSGR